MLKVNFRKTLARTHLCHSHIKELPEEIPFDDK